MPAREEDLWTEITPHDDGLFVVRLLIGGRQIGREHFAHTQSHAEIIGKMMLIGERNLRRIPHAG